jgi:hypothetical protein
MKAAEMPTLQRFSEPYPPNGGIASQGVKNLLGRPNIEPLELLAREALQNSWDAKRADSGTVRVAVSLFSLNPDSMALLTRCVVPDPPPHLPLGEVLGFGPVSLLCFADRGTCGLGGDLRANSIQAGEPSDFVDFVRNIGEPPDREFGGGSFGYGKGAFYLLSKASTILVHTRCEVPSGIESRFIACALGDNYNDQDGERVRRTGRHWWGVISEGVVDPAVGEGADELAKHLGLPEFEGEETGTTVAIVAPKLLLDTEDGEQPGGEEQEVAMEFLQDAVLWSFWPKMISRGELAPGMTFSFSVEGGDLEPVVPDTHPQLREFASALRALDGDETPPCLEQVVEPLSSQKPKKSLGSLSLRRFSAEPVDPKPCLPLAAKQMESGVYHVALMRAAELVVEYIPGPALPSSFVGYAGVFKCAEDLDQVFRKAEPPSHDKWEAKSLEGHERTYVNVALRRVRDHAEQFASPVGTTAAAADDLPIGQFASQLAGLVPTLPGLGASVSSGSAHTAATITSQTTTDQVQSDLSGDGSSESSGGGGAHLPDAQLSPPNVEIVTPGRPVLYQDHPVLETKFRVKASASDSSKVALSGGVGVLTLDGAAIESDAPQGAEVPSVVRWISPDGIEHEASRRLVVALSELQEPWAMQTDLLSDAAVRLDIFAEWDPE